MNIQLLSHMYNYVCMYMYVCMLSTCIYYSTFYFDSGGADCTRNVSLLTHLKHRVSISVFQSNSESSNNLLPVPLDVLDMVLHRNFS